LTEFVKLTHCPQNRLELNFSSVVHFRSISQMRTTIIITIASRQGRRNGGALRGHRPPSFERGGGNGGTGALS